MIFSFLVFGRCDEDFQLSVCWACVFVCLHVSADHETVCVSIFGSERLSCLQIIISL